MQTGNELQCHPGLYHCHNTNPPRAHYAIKMVTSRRVTRVGGIFTFTMGSGTISQTNTGIVMNFNDSKRILILTVLVQVSYLTCGMTLDINVL